MLEIIIHLAGFRPPTYDATFIPEQAPMRTQVVSDSVLPQGFTWQLLRQFHTESFWDGKSLLFSLPFHNWPKHREYLLLSVNIEQGCWDPQKYLAIIQLWIYRFISGETNMSKWDIAFHFLSSCFKLFSEKALFHYFPSYFVVWEWYLIFYCVS